MPFKYSSFQKQLKNNKKTFQENTPCCIISLLVTHFIETLMKASVCYIDSCSSETKTVPDSDRLYMWMGKVDKCQFELPIPDE